MTLQQLSEKKKVTDEQAAKVAFLADKPQCESSYQHTKTPDVRPRAKGNKVKIMHK